MSFSQECPRNSPLSTPRESLVSSGKVIVSVTFSSLEQNTTPQLQGGNIYFASQFLADADHNHLATKTTKEGHGPRTDDHSKAARKYREKEGPGVEMWGSSPHLQWSSLSTNPHPLTAQLGALPSSPKHAPYLLPPYNLPSLASILETVLPKL